MSFTIRNVLEDDLINQVTNDLANNIINKSGYGENNAIAIGQDAGSISQGTGAISLGTGAGSILQGYDSISIGSYSGVYNQGDFAISIGGQDPMFTVQPQIDQQFGAISIGAASGNLYQGTGAVAIGFLSGTLSQGLASIAIGPASGGDGTGFVGGSQSDFSIILNSSTGPLNSEDPGLYIKPIRDYSGDSNSSILTYRNDTCEVFLNTNKTFVIDHPINKEKYLVHACVESPSSNLLYNGVGNISKDNNSVDIQLPDYVEKIGRNFTVSLTPKGSFNNLYTNGVIDGKYFTVFGNKNSEFFWHVYGLMGEINSEPNKIDVNVSGNGPYKWI